MRCDAIELERIEQLRHSEGLRDEETNKSIRTRGPKKQTSQFRRGERGIKANDQGLIVTNPTHRSAQRRETSGSESIAGEGRSGLERYTLWQLASSVWR